jgi:hypothetical protein
VVELYVFSKLKRALDFERARSAWYAARQSGADLTQPMSFARLLCGEHAPIGILALSPEDLITAIPDAEPVRIVDLIAWIGNATSWYDAELRQNWGTSLPSSRSQSSTGAEGSRVERLQR